MKMEYDNVYVGYDNPKWVDALDLLNVIEGALVCIISTIFSLAIHFMETTSLEINSIFLYMSIM